MSYLAVAMVSALVACCPYNGFRRLLSYQRSLTHAVMAKHNCVLMEVPNVRLRQGISHAFSSQAVLLM